MNYLYKAPGTQWGSKTANIINSRSLYQPGCPWLALDLGLVTNPKTTVNGVEAASLSTAHVWAKLSLSRRGNRHGKLGDRGRGARTGLTLHFPYGFHSLGLSIEA